MESTPEAIDNRPFTPLPTTPKNIPIETITELRDKGLSCSQIAKIVGCSKVNVSLRLRYSGYNKGEIKTYKKNRADIFAWMQDKLLSSITEEDIKKTPVGSRILGVAQLYDKERLENDQSSANIAHQVSIAPELRSALGMVSTKMDKVIEVSGGDNKPENRDEDSLDDD
jgi:predicted transcriptional regulator